MVNFNPFSRNKSSSSSTITTQPKLQHHEKYDDPTKLEDSIHHQTTNTSIHHPPSSNRLFSKLRSTSSQRSSSQSSSISKLQPPSSSNSNSNSNSNSIKNSSNLQTLSPQALSSHSSLLSPSPSQSSTFSRFRNRASSLIKPNHQIISSSSSTKTITTTDQQLSYHLPPLDAQEELAILSDPAKDHQTHPIMNSIQSSTHLTPQIKPPTSPTRSCLTSSPLSFRNSTSQSNQNHSNIMSSQSRSQSQPQSKFKSTPSIRSNNTIFSIRSKLRVGRRKNPDEESIHRQNSQTSLATTIHQTNSSTPPISTTSPKPNSSASLYTDPPSIKPTDFNNSSNSSFQLKSFRNVRSTSSPGVPLVQSIPSTPTRQQTTPNQKTTITQSATPTQSVRPSPVPLIQHTPPTSPNPPRSRPSSPSSSKRISAAAFREARQARTTSRSSLTSTYSDKPFLQYDPHQNNSQNRLSYWPPPSPSTNLYQGFTTPSMMNAGRAMSDIGSPTQHHHHHHHHQSGTPKPHSSDHFKRNITQPNLNTGRLSYYHSSKAFDTLGSHDHDADILIPPRPAFYGSSSPRPTHDRSNSSSSTPQFYKNPSSSQRSLASSQRSLPIHSQTRPVSSVIKTPTKAKDSTLDKWHSDSDSEEDRSSSQPKPKPKATTTEEDEEDDEIPLSKLKKKSLNSLREIKSITSSSSSTSHQIPPISITSTSLPTSTKLPFLLNVTLPPSTSANLIQQQQYRGISPASSSSGGSGGPITPADSSLAINLLRKEEEAMLEHAPTGVDQFLYNGLTPEDKLQLHQRSQMMMQMIAAQAQMHAISLSNLHQQPGSFENPNRFSNQYRGSQSVIGLNHELNRQRNPMTTTTTNNSSTTITKFNP